MIPCPIRATMQACGLSPERLARRLTGYSLSTIRRYMAGGIPKRRESDLLQQLQAIRIGVER